ncbi:MAG: galactosyltransferase-related protein [Mycobacterium sp.]
MRTAVVTTVRGRGPHLRRQLQGLACSTRQPDMHIVVALGDLRVADIVADEGSPASVVNLDVAEPLPLAHARNQGAATALRMGAELLVFLDVDCIPDTELIARYHRAAQQPQAANALLCGPVTYLAPPGPDGYLLDDLRSHLDPHPARPNPPDNEVVATADYALFWSLSFAVTATTWTRIGGFCERYRGYGGEDTDFAQCAAVQGISMRWVGGAHAFHQFHPNADPPVEHVDDIVRNARIFHRRWGWWPMEGWLAGFELAGIIVRDAAGRPRVTLSADGES